MDHQIIKSSEYNILKLSGSLGHSDFHTIVNLITNLSKIGQNIILDLEGVPFLNSVIIGAIIEGNSHVEKDHNHLVICNAQHDVLDIFNLVGLDKVIKIKSGHRDAKRFFDELIMKID